MSMPMRAGYIAFLIGPVSRRFILLESPTLFDKKYWVREVKVT